MDDPFTADVPVRYRDLDPLNHVNHAVFASYLEAARVAFFDEVLEVAAEDTSFVIANLQIDYERPIVAGDEPTVALWIDDLGTSSCTMAYEIRVDDDVAATAETTLVHVDSKSKRPSALPGAFRERIRKYAGPEVPA